MENKLAYRLRVLKGASYGKMKEVVDEVHNRTGKNKLAIMADILHCSRKFGSGYYDYIIYHLYELNDVYRDTYMTRMRSKKLVTFMNDESYAHIFDNKNEFDEVFHDYIARDFLDAINCTREEAKEYYENHEMGFGKMLDLACGIGAEILDMKDFADGDAFYDYIKEKGFGVVEDYIQNHHTLREIYPKALNTMRLITMIGDDGKPYLFFAAQKFGVNGRFIDVHGIHSPIDPETGKITFPFHSGNTETDLMYTKHPDTGAELIGLEIPYFQEAKEMILKAAMEVPQMRYIGWDVAVTEKGPLIIEGNNYTAYDYMQLPGQNPDKIGIIPEVLKIVPSFATQL